MKYHYTSLRVYATADALVEAVYHATTNFPREELYATVSQMRRAALSVVLNILEGNGRRLSSTKEFKRYLVIAISSLYELEYLISFSARHQYFSTEKEKELAQITKKCGAQLWRLLHTLN